MTRHHVPQSVATLVLCLVAAATSLQGIGLGQQGVPAGISANWKDLETWSTEVAETRDQMIGLGLQPSSSSGFMRIAFSATLLRRAPSEAPKQVLVTWGQNANFNPNLVRTWHPELSFVAIDRAKRPRFINVTSITWLPLREFGPHAIVSEAQAVLQPEQFLQIAQADRLTATVVGVEATFTAEHLKALRTFGERARLIK